MGGGQNRMQHKRREDCGKNEKKEKEKTGEEKTSQEKNGD